ncbi:MAG: hypothetical protein ACKPFD_11445 [Dolichospermum sp.]
MTEEELLPKLWKGAVVVMDNLKAHKMKGIIEMIESVGREGSLFITVFT